MLAEVGRARGLYELAISQPVLDMPEAVWKAYIDFEIGQVSTRNTVVGRCGMVRHGMT
jgi:crooked neck